MTVIKCISAEPVRIRGKLRREKKLLTLTRQWAALLAEFNLFCDAQDAPLLTMELDFGCASFCWGKKQLYPLTLEYDTE